MPKDASRPASSAEYDHGLALAKEEDRWILPALRINRYFNRPLASLIVRALFRTRVTPNQVTWAGFLLGLAGAGCFLAGSRGAFLAGGMLAQLSSIVDCADGMLARARGRTSEYGAALDIVLDRVGEFALIVAASLGHFRRFGSHRLLAAGLLAAALYFLQLTLFYLIKAYRKDPRLAETAENRAWLMALIAVFAAADRVDIGIYVLLAASSAVVAYLLAEFLFLRRNKRA